MLSSVIRDFAYDPVAHRLDVLFNSGNRYSYFDVPERLFHGMARAISKGSFFNHRIRSRFRYARRR
jgi:hypothetical protein